MHTLATFLVSFPEFTSIDSAYVHAKLDEAELQIDPDVWGTLETAGHGYLAAHLLALSPFGNTAKLDVSKSVTTTYERHYRRLVGMVTQGIRST